jgi:hypothetical protein
LLIETNTSPLRRVDKGFTTLPKSQSGRANMCGMCALQSHCPVVKNQPLFATQHVITCENFIPPFRFSNVSGLDFGSFNTMRLGKAWFNRLVRGDFVALLDQDNDVYSYMEVTKVLVGNKEKMIRNHAVNNHLCLDKGLKKRKSETYLTAKLPSVFGNLIWKNNEIMTVIYLERIRSEELEALLNCE